jgi:hypothetical protein
MALTKKRIEELKKLYVRSVAGVSNAQTPADQIQAHMELLRIFRSPFGAGGRSDFEELLALAEKQLDEHPDVTAVPTMQFSCVKCNGPVTYQPNPGIVRCVKCGIVTDIRAEAPKR